MDFPETTAVLHTAAAADDGDVGLDGRQRRKMLVESESEKRQSKRGRS